MRGGWRAFSGLICDCVNVVGQANFIFVGEKSGHFKILWLWQPCNMYLITYILIVQLLLLLFLLLLIYHCHYY